MKPSHITGNRQNHQLLVMWEDDHESIYSFSLLRYACPCAFCRGGHEKMTTIPDPVVFTLPEDDRPSTRLINIEAVGTYALTLQWEDDHGDGIYTWSYLRALCPCEQCRAGVISRIDD